MKIITKNLLASSLFILMAVPVHAGSHRDGGHRMDRAESHHVWTVGGCGSESGFLKHKEGKMLKEQKRKTHVTARTFNEDSALSKKERLIVNRRQNKRGERIWAFKHNDNERCASRDAHRDASWQHRHHRHHGYKGGTVNWCSDANAWPRYGFLFR